jgi:hypothetical protein
MLDHTNDGKHHPSNGNSKRKYHGYLLKKSPKT